MAATDRLIVAPEERRPAVLDVITAARRRLILSPVECDDRRVFEALRAAVARGVRVEAVLGHRGKRRSRTRLLSLMLETLGVRVHRYTGPYARYHAKYAVADGRVALIGSLNLTRRCFKSTCDFLVVTEDRGVASSLVAIFEADCRGDSVDPRRLSPRLIVAPGPARSRIQQIIERARHDISLIDPKVSDAAMMALLQAKAASVRVCGQRSHSALAAHGKLLVVDDDVAMVGSMALSTSNLDRRREIGVLVTDQQIVGPLRALFAGSRLAARCAA